MWRDRQWNRTEAEPHHRDMFRSSLCIFGGKEKCPVQTWSMFCCGLRRRSGETVRWECEAPSQFRQEWWHWRCRLVFFWLHQSKFQGFFHQPVSKNCRNWVWHTLYDGWIPDQKSRISLWKMSQTYQNWSFRHCYRRVWKWQCLRAKRVWNLLWEFSSMMFPDGWFCQLSTEDKD
jgi:hypothetical protein